MANNFIRAAALILAMVMTALAFPAPTAEAASDDLSAIIERQIRAYADSINQKDADDTAAQAIAAHGIKGGGKKLSVGASHALTATLMNSELLQSALSDGITCAVESMQSLGWATLLMKGGACWRSSSLNYNFGVYEGESVDKENLIFPLSSAVYSGAPNTYDDSLEWISGDTGCRVSLERIKVTATEVTYAVTVTVDDRFDFSTASNSGFKNLISAIGALLFREFDWESTVTFEVTAPYSCTHSSANYHWKYDPNTYTITSQVSDEYIENKVSHKTRKAGSSAEQYYHKLTSTTWLLHNREWAVEYTVKGYAYFSLSSHGTSPNLPSLLHAGGTGAYFVYSEAEDLTAEEQEKLGLSSPVANCLYRYGRSFETDFASNDSHSYTYRYKNRVSDDGNNTIFLSVYDNTLQKQVLKPTPLKQYQRIVQGIVVDSQKDSNWLSGKDFSISSIGNCSYALNNCDFELFIWENGEGGESYDYFETKTVTPTCAGEGYTAHTCAACGYSYKTDIVPAKPHSYTTKVTKPTCTEKGYTTYTCTTCGYSHKADIVPAKGHDYITEVTPPTCTEEGYTTYTCTVCSETRVGDTVKALKHSYGAGYCSRCGDDTVTASIVGGHIDLRATKGIKVGTWVLVAGYAANGRMTGFHARLWDGTPQTLDLPVGENYVLYFVKEGTWEPLRLPVVPK